MERFRIQIQGMENRPELMRTLTTLFSTRAGSQPADRDFGISWECLDEVPEVAESLFCMEAEKKVARYEPRVQIEEITFGTGNGELTVQLFFSGREEH
ncbi:MAG: GPW/gp25 family protein [Hungatella sp.]